MLNEKVAVITGCNGGIGYEILKLFYKNNVKKIFACVRNLNDKLNQELKKINTDNNIVEIIECDFSKEEDVKKASELILSKTDKIDIIVNNAATISTALFQMTTVQSIKKTFDINFFHQFRFTQIISKSMIKKKYGNIVFIASSSAQDGNPGRSAYSSSKAAIISLSKTLSREYGKENIRVNCISPGPINTEMLIKNSPKSIIDEVVDRSSLKRLGNPEEVANLVLFLCSDLSSFITGQNIRIDGGMN